MNGRSRASRYKQKEHRFCWGKLKHKNGGEVHHDGIRLRRNHLPTKTFRTNVPPDIMGPRASRPSAGTRPYRLRNGNDSGRLLPRTQKHPAAAPGPLQGSNERTQATAPPPPTPTASRTSPSPRSSAPLSPPIPPCRASRLPALPIYIPTTAPCAPHRHRHSHSTRTEPMAADPPPPPPPAQLPPPRRPHKQLQPRGYWSTLISRCAAVWRGPDELMCRFRSRRVCRYQVEVFAAALRGNTIAVLDTGSGKTMVAIMLARQHVLRARAGETPRRIVVFLAPTVHLVHQVGLRWPVLSSPRGNVVGRGCVFDGGSGAFLCLCCSNSRWFGSTQTSTRWSAMGHRGLATGTPSAGRKQLAVRR